jgi:predicted MPP superfamily phosphohydrolase
VRKPRRRVARVATLGVAIVFSAAVAYRGFVVNPYDLRILRLDIPCAGLAHGPIRILLLSDVDFPRYQSNLDRAAEAARAFDPDFVFVAGDFLDRASMVADPDVRRAARAWFDSLPARGRRLLAPGEEESPALRALRSSWSPEAIEALANESRRFEIRGDRLDVFVADRQVDPAPWRVLEDGGRWTATAHCGDTDTYIQLARPGTEAWGNVEVTLALRIEQADGRVLLRFAADPAADPRSSNGLILLKGRFDPRFRLYERGPGTVTLSGRAESGYIPPVGVWIRCRVRIVNEANATRIQTRFWTEGDAEPTSWMIDTAATGATRPRQGTIALGGMRGVVQFADLLVTDTSAQPLFRDTFDDQKRFRADWSQRSRLGDWLASDPSGAIRLVLAHTPDVALDVEAFSGGPLAAIFAGHTHGGQVSLPWLGALYTSTHLGRSFDRGLFQVAETPLFITAGVGTSIVPIRLGVPPDVALITLRPVVSSGP